MNERKKPGDERETIVDKLTDPKTGRPKAEGAVPLQGSMLNALDMRSADGSECDPDDIDARIDINSDESFPASDSPATSQPGWNDKDPPPGGKYD